MKQIPVDELLEALDVSIVLLNSVIEDPQVALVQKAAAYGGAGFIFTFLKDHANQIRLAVAHQSLKKASKILGIEAQL